MFSFRPANEHGEQGWNAPGPPWAVLSNARAKELRVTAEWIKQFCATANHWANEHTSIDFIETVMVPFFREQMVKVRSRRAAYDQQKLEARNLRGHADRLQSLALDDPASFAHDAIVALKEANVAEAALPPVENAPADPIGVSGPGGDGAHCIAIVDVWYGWRGAFSDYIRA